jgi:hypothetical protein
MTATRSPEHMRSAPTRRAVVEHMMMLRGSDAHEGNVAREPNAGNRQP